MASQAGRRGFESRLPLHLFLTADEMSLPLFPCPKKFTFWDTTLLPRGTFWVRVPRRPARGRPKAVFLLLACCTQEEDAGPASRLRAPRPSKSCGSATTV